MSLPPRVSTPNDKSSPAGTEESSGSSDKNYKSLFWRIPKPRRARMAVVINSRPWEEYFDQEYDLVTTRIYLPRHYSTWHSRIMRDVDRIAWEVGRVL